MKHILLVEPDVPLATIYQAALQQSGYSVAHCTMAQQAIICADNQRPDLILLELGLTAHGGIEFLYELRSYADWRNVPVIIVSHVPPEELRDSRVLLTAKLGIEVYHYKPNLQLRDLLSSIQRSLSAADRRHHATA